MPSPSLRTPSLSAVLTLGLLVAGCGDDQLAVTPPFPWDFDAGAVDAITPRADAAADAAGDLAVDGGTVPGGMDPFTVIVLPDTQYYASNFPEIFDAQTAWIVAQKEPGRIAFVLHEGDIVDSDVELQWQRASHSLHQLDGIVPYVLAIGNHDLGGADRRSTLSTYFPKSKYAMTPGYGGTFDDERIDNSYFIFEAGGSRWLVVSLEFGPRDEVLVWADSVVKAHADLTAIIVTHAYLYSDDTRYDYENRPDQHWNPKWYMLQPPANDGEDMWQKLVASNSNIRFVLSGHVLNDGIGLLTDTRPDGSRVHQILANYQNGDWGGGGYLRSMEFFPLQRTIRVRTFSPFFNQFATDPANEFMLQY